MQMATRIQMLPDTSAPGSGEVQLKSKSVPLYIHTKIAKLVNARVTWPGALAGVGLNPILGRLLESLQWDDIDLSRLKGQLAHEPFLVI